MLKITLKDREHDVVAYANDDKALWDCGKTKREAIGHLIMTHRKTLGIEIEDL